MGTRGLANGLARVTGNENDNENENGNGNVRSSLLALQRKERKPKPKRKPTLELARFAPQRTGRKTKN
jgi:hypothetical protein